MYAIRSYYAILTCGDSWLFQQGAYDHRLLHRLEQFRSLPAAHLGPATQLYEHYVAAAQSALRPGAPVSQSRADPDPDANRSAGREDRAAVERAGPFPAGQARRDSYNFV